jgi:hypothetical protein
MKKGNDKIYQLVIKKLGSDFVNRLRKFEDCGVIELKKDQALGIYTIRNKVQKETNIENYLFGYDELLKRLDEFDESKVLVHTFLNNKDLFVFFTDSKLKTIIGFLSNRVIEK